MKIRVNENNKFGHTTWTIEIDVHLHLLIHKSNSSSFLVEFKELFIVFNKTHFSFISNSSLKETILKAFDELYNYLTKNKGYLWSQQQKNKMLIEALSYIIHNEQFILQFKYNNIIEFFKSHYPNVDFKEINDELKFLIKAKDTTSAMVYSLKEKNNLIHISFSLFNSLGLFVKSWEYPIDENQFVIIKDFENNLNQLFNKLELKKAENLMNNFYSSLSEVSEDYSGFEFDKMNWDLDYEKDIFSIKFLKDSGETKEIVRKLIFDFGSIILLDSNKTINEIIKDLNIGSFSLLDKGGIVFTNVLDEVLIKGWGADEFLIYQKQISEENKNKNNKDNNNGLSDVGFLNRNYNYGLKLYSLNYCFSDASIEKYKNIIDWDYLSSNENINWTPELIEKYHNKWNWQRLSSNESLPWSLELYKRYENYFNLLEMSSNPKVPWNKEIFMKLIDNDIALSYACYSGNHHWDIPLIEEVTDIIYWDSLCTNENIKWSKEIIDRFHDKICWEELSSNKSLIITSELFEKYKSKFNLELLYRNEAFWINNELKDKYMENFPWNEASCFTNLNWSIDFIAENKHLFNWRLMSSNPSLPWSMEFYEQFKDLISLYSLSSNESFPWSENFIEMNKNKLNWDKDYLGLSNNEGLPWSQKFIEKYENLWEFGRYHENSIYDGIGNRINVPWDMNLLLKYEKKWDYKILLMNPSIWEKAFSKFDDSLAHLFFQVQMKK